MKKRKVFQRLFSALLALTLAVTMMPGGVYAAEISGNEALEPEEAEISGNEALEPEEAEISGNEVSEPEEAAVSSNGTGKEDSPEGVTLSEAGDSVLEGQIANLPEEAWGALVWEGKPAYASVSPGGPWDIQDQTVMLEGALPYVTGFTGYDEERKNQEGYYAALRIPISDEAQALAAASKGVVFTVKGDQEKSFSYSEELIQGAAGAYHIDLIWRLNPEQGSFTITPDWDGEGTDYKATDYTIDTRGIVFGAKPRGRIEETSWGGDIYISSSAAVPIKNGMGIRYAGGIGYSSLKKENAELLHFCDKEGALITEGHFAAVRITAPHSITDVKNTRVIADSAGEPAYTDFSSIKGGGRYIYQIFYVTRDSLGTAKTITVDWNGEYEEIYTVEFASSLLLGRDWNAPAAPKSLALVSPEKTMYVDQTQQLSVKVTRNRAEERIRLGCKSDNEDVAGVSSSGLVTARKEGKAVITVYPLDKNGQAMKDSKGRYVKSAKVTITVKKVTAPARLKADGIGDTFAMLSWKENTTGSKTELYILPGKGKKAADFEAAIGAGTDPLKPEAVYREETEGYLDGLKAYTDYTVYARTVSANGSSAAGSVIPLKTTRLQPVGLRFVNEEGNPIDGKDFAVDKDHKTLMVKAEFIYPQGASPEERLTNIKPVYEIVSSTRSTIDKNGKITFKDAEDVEVRAYYEIPGFYPGIGTTLNIDVTAEAAKISSRTTKLSVGQKAEIGALVAYDVEGVEKSFTKETLEAFRKAADKEGKPMFEVAADAAADGGYTIQALRPGNAAVEMKEERIEKTAKAVIKVSPLAAPGAFQIDEYCERIVGKFKAVPEADYYQIEVLYDDKSVLFSQSLENYYNPDDPFILHSFDLLTANNKYYVRITALFGDDQASKPVISKAIKYTGPEISMHGKKLKLYETDPYGNEYEIRGDEGSLVIGVGYTKVLAAEVGRYIQAAETDTLIWESSDPKVAAIKANKSSFGAQLTGVKCGKATITISSKKTKHVAMTFTVDVCNN